MNNNMKWAGLGAVLAGIGVFALLGYLKSDRNALGRERAVLTDGADQPGDTAGDSADQPRELAQPESQTPLVESRQVVEDDGAGAAESEASKQASAQPEQPLVVRAHWEGRQIEWDSVELVTLNGPLQSLSASGELLLSLKEVREVNLQRAVVDGFTADASWQSDELHLQLRDGSQLSVAEAGTHKPIGGAQIELPIKSQGEFIRLIGSLVRLPHAESTAVVKISAVGYEPLSVGMLPGTGRRVAELESGACEVRFHVTSAYDPVQIEVMGCHDFFTLLREQLERDEDGGFSHVRSLGPGKYHATLKADLEAGTNVWSWPVLDYKVFEVFAGGEAVDVHLSDEPVKGSLTGSVTIADPGLDRELIVRADSVCGGYGESLVLESKMDQRTSQELTWSFDGLFPAEYRVFLQSEGLSQMRTVQAGAAAPPVHFLLNEEVFVHIWVLDGEQPVPNAEVRINPGPELEQMESGAFEARMSVVEEGWISALADGYQRASKSVTLQPGLNVFELQLKKGGESKLHLKILCDGAEIPVTLDVITKRLKLRSISGEVVTAVTAESSGTQRSTGDLRADSSFDILGYQSVGVFQVELEEGEGYSSSTGIVELVAGERVELTLNVKALE